MSSSFTTKGLDTLEKKLSYEQSIILMNLRYFLLGWEIILEKQLRQKLLIVEKKVKES